MAEEKNLWIQLKNNTKSIIWTRIESSTGLGIPDLFGYYKRGFWVELKVIVNNKINFSAHQIAWIHRHYSAGCPVPETLFRRPLNYSQAPLSVIPRPLAKNIPCVPLAPDPSPRAGSSSC
jgi:hypothetical protein